MKMHLKKTLFTGIAFVAFSNSAAHATTISVSTAGPLTLTTGNTLTVTNTGSLHSSGGADNLQATGTPTGAIVNNGSITSANERAIVVTGTVNGGIDNNSGATISSGNGHGIEVSSGAVTADGNGYAIYNNGTISTTGDVGFGDSSAIRLASATITGNIFNDTGGVISGYVYGVNLQGGTTVTGSLLNSGTISGGTYAIFVAGGTLTGGVTNNSGGIIGNGTGDGIHINSGSTLGQITNNGTISSTSGYAVYNNGSLTTLANTNGTISATTGQAINNDTGGTITSLTNSSGLITATGSGGIGIKNVSSIGTLDNTAGTISTTAGDAIFNSGAGSTITTLTNGTGGTILSSTANYNAIHNQGLITSLTNSGTITANAQGNTGISTDIYNDGGTITTLTNNASGVINLGGVANNGTSATIANGNDGSIGTLTNAGQITAGSIVAGINNLGGSTIGTFNNSGSITGSALYVYDNQGTTNTITNSGTMSTTNGIGIANSGSITTLTNTQSGVISTSRSNEAAILNLTTISALGNQGTISAGDGGFALYNFPSATITTLTNSGVIHATNDVALYNAGAMTLDNTNGTIRAITGSAIQLNAPLTTGSINQPYNVTNTNGLITSASTGNGTIYVTADIGTPTIIGGTISNTSTSDSAVAVNIAANQAGTYSAIDFDNVHLIADGDTPGSGHGIALTNGTGGSNAAVAEFSDNTVVRGNIVSSGSLHLLFYNASVTGNITLGGTNNELDITDGVTVAGNVAFGTGVNSFYVFPTVSFATGGTFVTAGGGQTNLEIDSGTFIVNNAVGLGSGTILIYNGAALNLAAGDVTSTGAFTNNGTTSIGVGRSLNVGSIDTTAMNGVLSFTASNSGSTLLTGHINTGATAANLSNQTVSVNYIGGLGLTNSSRSLIASGTGNATGPIAAVIDNSYLYGFSVIQGTTDPNDLYLQTTLRYSPTAASDTANNANAANVLSGPTINSSDPVISQIQANLNNAPTRQAYNNVVQSTLPTVDHGAASGATNFTADVFDVADSQLTTVDTGLQTGVAAGNETHGLHPWMQGFGSYASQGMRSDVPGYNASTYGAAFGLDTRELVDDTVLGMSFAYGRTNVNSNNTNNTTTNVNTYQGMIYGNHQFAEDYFVTGMGAFGWDTNNENRQNVGAIAGLNASADYNSWQAATRWEVGRNFKDLPTNMTLTPSLISDYLHYQANGYTENGAGGADLHVGSRAENQLNLGLGLQAEWLFETEDGSKLRPNLHGSYKYDVLNNDAVDTTSSFAAGGGTFTTNGLNPSPSTYDLGTGMKFYNTGNWDFTATYDHTFKADYNSDSGIIRAAYKF